MRSALFFILLMGQFLLANAATQTAVFAGGCFWCMQADFDKLSGVVSTTAGYDGGLTANPTYEQVSAGKTNYLESVKVVFDPEKLSYSQLLNYYWHHIDPTDSKGQFCDKGNQYKSVIFYSNVEQQQQALASLATIKKQFTNVYTQVLPSTSFYPAETYHQKYYLKNPLKYEYYRWSCGRDQTVKEVWNGKS